MSVNTSAIPAAITYLVAAATAAFPTALVTDGPLTVVDQEATQDRVSIGWDGDPNGFVDAVEGSQEVNALNWATTRNEDFVIVCSVTHWDGDNDIASARTKAFALLAAFERLLRGVPPNGSGDVTLGGAVLWAVIGGGISVAYPQNGTDGTACHVVFHVTCRARLTGS